MKKENVIVLGASSKEERYSFKAVSSLIEHGHMAIPVHPREKEVAGLKCFNNLSDVEKMFPQIDTVTIYVNPQISMELSKEILKLRPKRVIFNPGSENRDLMEILKQNNVDVLEACTLVLLNIGEY